MTNSRNKGASFEREIANALNDSLELKKPLKRILEQTREKHLPDLILGNWYIECKRYGQGAEPLEGWWDQVIAATPELQQSLDPTSLRGVLRLAHISYILCTNYQE